MTERTALELSSVAHLESPDGHTATNLDGLREGIETVPATVIFHHVTRISIRHPGARDLPANDFARWVGIALQDQETAERLAFAGAGPLEPLEDVRASLVRVLAGVPGRRRRQEAPEGSTFHFVRAQNIVVPLGVEVHEAADLVERWAGLDLGAVFHHLIEAPLLGPEGDPIVPWLESRGASRLAKAAETLASSGLPLARLHHELGIRWRRLQIPDRLVRRLEAPEDARRAEGRAAMARLASRLRGTPPEEPNP